MTKINGSFFFVTFFSAPLRQFFIVLAQLFEALFVFEREMQQHDYEQRHAHHSEILQILACSHLSAAYVGHHHQINKQQQRQPCGFLVFIVG